MPKNIPSVLSFQDKNWQHVSLSQMSWAQVPITSLNSSANEVCSSHVILCHLGEKSLLRTLSAPPSSGSIFYTFPKGTKLKEGTNSVQFFSPTGEATNNICTVDSRMLHKGLNYVSNDSNKNNMT